MRELVIQYGGELRIASAILGTISFLFGTKGLGRFPSLAKPGGFYSTIVMAIPAGLFLGALAYFFVAITSNLPIQLVGLIFHIQIDATTYVAFVTLLSTATIIAAPELFRRKYDPTGANITVQDIAKGIVGPIGAVIGFAAAWVTYTISAGATTYFVFDVLGWFSGYKPSVFLLVGIALLIVVLQTMRGIFLAMSLTTRHIADLLTEGLNDDEIEKLPENQLGSALIAFGISKRENTLSVIAFLLSYVMVIPLAVANSALIIYLARNIGWSVVIYVTLTVLSFPLLRALRRFADRLDTKGLLAVFAVPGFFASAIPFMLLNTNLLPN